ncbi:MAG: alpha/beta fold hydrolase [Phycicoccus sp.]
MSAPTSRVPDPARPGWVDQRLFPFTSRFTEIDGNVVHYVDEGTGSGADGTGSGPVLLMVHGNPTWSFLFRDLIVALRPAFRCVALDLPGFGLSTATNDYGFRPDEHARILERFVEHLDLRDVILFGQDWGGPIGLAAAQAHPARYAGLVLSNTRAWPPLTESERQGPERLGGALGNLLIGRLNVMTRLMMPLLAKRRTLTRQEMRHYLAPFPTAASRKPVLELLRSISGATEFLLGVEAGLDRLTHLPVLIAWPEHGDRGFPLENRDRFCAVFPQHTQVNLQDTGHFVWQDSPDMIVREFRSWWRRVGHEPPAESGGDELKELLS